MFAIVIIVLFTFFNIVRLTQIEEQFDTSAHKLTFSYGEPLLLTPLLEAKKKDGLEKARNTAKVKPFAGKVQSYSGYFTVNKKYNSNLFFWFFESETGSENAPLLLWLHGGPGQSSLMTLFQENGPWRILNDKVVLAENSWTKNHNVLYIENPIGTGFSYTSSPEGHSNSLEDAASNLYNGLTQFFKLFPGYKNNSFFLTGHSYAGRYIPKLALLIHKKNNKKNVAVKINLKGLFIGAGFIDPVNQLHFSDYFYHHGIFDMEERDLIRKREQQAQDAMKNEKYKKAQFHLNQIRSKLVSAGYKQPFVDVLDPHYNLSTYGEVVKFLRKDDVRKAIHVGFKKFKDIRKNCWYFKAYHLNSVSSELSEVLKHYKVLLYSGQFDMVVPPVQIERVIESLSWDGVEAFKKTVSYEKWFSKGKLAGFMKAYRNLIQVMVRRANHFIISSQPEYILDLISWFTEMNS